MRTYRDVSQYFTAFPCLYVTCLPWQENLCPLRGLEANSDIQTFEVFLTDRVRQLYDKITQLLTEVFSPLQDYIAALLLAFSCCSLQGLVLNPLLSRFLRQEQKKPTVVLSSVIVLSRVIAQAGVGENSEPFPI